MRGNLHGCQSSFFNFYYCRLNLIRVAVPFVNPLSLISTIVDEVYKDTSSIGVNPLSLISTIVDLDTTVAESMSQSSFFNFYYCRLFFQPLPILVNPLSLISTIVDYSSK